MHGMKDISDMSHIVDEVGARQDGEIRAQVVRQSFVHVPPQHLKWNWMSTVDL